MPGFPNRCQHIKVNGTVCGSPALRRNRFCYFHKRTHEERIRLSTDRARRRPAAFVLPVLEDANSVQVALMQVLRLLALGQLDSKTAGLMLYALQTASSNLRNTRFEPFHEDVVLDPRAVGDVPLDEHVWEEEDFVTEDEDDEEEEDPLAALIAARKERAKQEELEKWEELEDAHRWGSSRPGHPLTWCTKHYKIVATPRQPAPPSPPAPPPPRLPSGNVDLSQARKEVQKVALNGILNLPKETIGAAVKEMIQEREKKNKETPAEK